MPRADEPAHQVVEHGGIPNLLQGEGIGCLRVDPLRESVKLLLVDSRGLRSRRSTRTKQVLHIPGHDLEHSVFPPPLPADFDLAHDSVAAFAIVMVYSTGLLTLLTEELEAGPESPPLEPEVIRNCMAVEAPPSTERISRDTVHERDLLPSALLVRLMSCPCARLYV